MLGNLLSNQERTIPGLLRDLGWVCSALILASGIGADGAAGQETSGVVTGRVIEASSGEPVSAAAVELRRQADSTTVSSAATGYNGQFRLTGVPEGSYFIQVSSLGYGERVTAPFQVEGGTVYDLGLIELAIQALDLDPISVVEARPAVIHEADRTSYLLHALPSAEGGTISDALRDVPELDVDFDGNVELAGEPPAIWIDGRPAPMSGRALALFLEQFPADLIDRIEIIDSPGSEYDAEGTGGIVNIVLREDADLGVSGSAFANADTRGNTGAGGRGTMQRGDWVWDGSASLRRRDSETDGFRLRQNLLVEPTDFVQRESWNASRSLGGNLGLRTTYTPREEARYWLGANWSGQGGERDGLVTTTHMDHVQDPVLRYDRAHASDTGDRSFNVRTGFEWRWEPRRHLLDMELRYGRGSDHRLTTEERLRDDGLDDDELDPPGPIPARLTTEDDESDERELRFDLRYRRPLGQRTSLRTGYSFRDESTGNARIITDAIRTGEQADIRGFDRAQTFNSAYLTVQRSLGHRLSVQAGIRAEHVDWDLAFPSAEPVAGRYFDLFPSVNLNWRHDRARRVRLSYSQRVGRPPVRVLDPTDRSTDPLERVVGNPLIQPRYTHRLNLNASWSGSLGTLAVRPYLSKTVDRWERITTVDVEGVSTRTWDNLSSETRTGASINYSFRDLGRWRGSANLSGSRSHRDADNLDPRYSGTASRWNARLNLHGPIQGGLTAQTAFRYRAASRSIQGRDGAQASVDVSFRYRLMDNRLSASLSLRDPFGLQESESEIHDLTVREIRRSSQAVRSARLSLSYGLGGGGRRR